jgi:phosphopantothenate synthetase
MLAPMQITPSLISAQAAAPARAPVSSAPVSSVEGSFAPLPLKQIVPLAQAGQTPVPVHVPARPGQHVDITV